MLMLSDVKCFVQFLFPFLLLDAHENANITIQLLVVLDRVLNYIKEYQFIKAPIEINLHVLLNFETQKDVDPHSKDKVLEWPEHISYWLLEIRRKNRVVVELVLLDLHSRDQVRIVVPHQAG